VGRSNRVWVCVRGGGETDWGRLHSRPDADVVSAFMFGCKCETLLHKLGCKYYALPRKSSTSPPSMLEVRRLPTLTSIRSRSKPHPTIARAQCHIRSIAALSL
jgi:hypothetical protein